MTISENISQIREKIAEYTALAGRPENSVRLLAVSKTFPAADIREAYDGAAQRMFGENRVVELVDKVPNLPADIEWHLIGHLQSNKAAKAAELAQWIHSVDSVKLVNKINAAATAANRKIKILLEYNWTGEESKGGIRSEDELRTVIDAVMAAPALEWKGFMTMAEFDADEKRLRETFAGVRTLRDRMAAEYGVTLPELSMGMSGDFREAILEGSTIVRVGTAIFGKR